MPGKNIRSAVGMPEILSLQIAPQLAYAPPATAKVPVMRQILAGVNETLCVGPRN
jgi:hypothetical protein